MGSQFYGTFKDKHQQACQYVQMRPDHGVVALMELPIGSP